MPYCKFVNFGDTGIDAVLDLAGYQNVWLCGNTGGLWNIPVCTLANLFGAFLIKKLEF